MCFDDENESVVSAQQDYTEDDFNIGDRVNTRNGAGVVAGIAKYGYPKILVQHDEWRGGHDGNGVERSGEEIPSGSGYFYDANELTRIVVAEKKELPKPIAGEGLSDEQQLIFEMLVARIVAIPMGYEPDSEEFRGRLIQLAESLEEYVKSGKRLYRDPKQESFENGIGDIAIALGFTENLALASAVRAFEKNTRLAEEAGVFEGLPA